VKGEDHEEKKGEINHLFLCGRKKILRRRGKRGKTPIPLSYHRANTSPGGEGNKTSLSSFPSISFSGILNCEEGREGKEEGCSPPLSICAFTFFYCLSPVPLGKGEKEKIGRLLLPLYYTSGVLLLLQ